jgi:ribonuclease P protein component
MLSKINRIKDKKLFPLILNKGAKYYCPFFLLLIEPTIKIDSAIKGDPAVKDLAELAQPEFGFITSKKVGGAVERNHVRRLLSEIVMKEIPLLKANTRAVIIAHNRATTLSFEQLQKEVQTIFTKAGIYT